jgi:hypothetical protein
MLLSNFGRTPATLAGSVATAQAFDKFYNGIQHQTRVNDGGSPHVSSPPRNLRAPIRTEEHARDLMRLGSERARRAWPEAAAFTASEEALLTQR